MANRMVMWHKNQLEKPRYMNIKYKITNHINIERKLYLYVFFIDNWICFIG